MITRWGESKRPALPFPILVVRNNWLRESGAFFVRER